MPTPSSRDKTSQRSGFGTILGTTGGGKSNTVARLVQQAQAANMAVVLLDVEGEYTHLHKPTPNAKMQSALAARGLEPQGLSPDAMTVYHLVGRDTANPDHPHVKPFSLQFARLSPYAACEILGLSDAQAAAIPPRLRHREGSDASRSCRSTCRGKSSGW